MKTATYEAKMFSYNNVNVRTVIKNDEPWFVAKDVCDVLGIGTEQIRRLDEDEKGLRIIQTPGGTQQLSIVNEPGLYSLILRSRKPEAKQFKRWITHEVIPTIRKTGGAYLTASKAEELLANPDLIIGLAQQVKQLQAERMIAEQERDEALRTKACISDRKTATALQRNSVLQRKINKMEEQLGIAENYMQAKAIPYIKKYFGKKPSKAAWIAIGKYLKSLADEMQSAIIKVASETYGKVNAYEAEVVETFEQLLLNDNSYMAKWRI